MPTNPDDLYDLVLKTLHDNATKPPATYQSVARAIVTALGVDSAGAAAGEVSPSPTTTDAEVSAAYVRQPCPAHCGAQGIFVTDKRNYWCEQCGAIGKFVSATIDSAPIHPGELIDTDRYWPETDTRKLPNRGS